MRANAPSLRVVETFLLAYRRRWKFNVATTLINPVFFLLGMGVGLGALIDKGQGSGHGSLEGVAYLSFLAPGLLAATAMQVAASESTYPIMARVKWDRIYESMLATPLRVIDVVLGQLGWIALRVLQTSVAFFLVTVLFGAVESPLGVFAVLGAALTGMAMSAPICAWAATRTNDYSMSTVLRFVIMPMFLFSGTFFPVSQLPAGIRAIAYVTPLWHGVDLCRSLSLGDADLVRVAAHVVYLGAFVVVGTLACRITFRRRLVE
jgi:lipooligosaccharide transport system permease protein